MHACSWRCGTSSRPSHSRVSPLARSAPVDLRSTFVEKALKLAQPDLESLVMEHHLKASQSSARSLSLRLGTPQGRAGCAVTDRPLLQHWPQTLEVLGCPRVRRASTCKGRLGCSETLSPRSVVCIRTPSMSCAPPTRGPAFATGSSSSSQGSTASGHTLLCLGSSKYCRNMPVAS